MENLCKLKCFFREIYKFENELKEKFNLSINEILTLCSLTEKEYSAGDLAREMGVSPGRMSKIIAGLESKDYINRKIGSQDKRQMNFALTDLGRQKITNIKKCDIHIPQPQIIK